MQHRLHAWDDAGLESAIQSILLVSGGPVHIGALAAALEVDRARVARSVRQLCERAHGGIRVQAHGDSAQLVTAPENVEVIHRFLGSSKPPALSRSNLEVLTIVAYRQPVTRSEIEAVRGVNSDRALQTLLARGLVEERGRRETLGRPHEYGTSFAFLEYFGLGSLDDLPELPGDAVDSQKPVELGLRDQ